MSQLRGVGELSRAYLLQTMRSKTALFWTLGFPQVWLFAFALIFADGSSNAVTFMMPGLFTITTMAGSFFGVSYLMVNERENDILRRYRLTPVSALTVVVANGARSMVTVTASLVLQGFLAWLFFDITVASSLVLLALVLWLGALAFVPLGLILGSVAKDMKSAPAIANLIFFPMMFLSGAAMPFYMLPGWVQQVARLLPPTYLTEALQGVIVRGDRLVDLAAPLVVLLISGVVAAALNGLLFRWESSEPVSLKRLAIALVGLAAIYTVAALMAPSLRMRQRPQVLSQLLRDTPARFTSH
ncbi:MAG: ABC transporter permease [Acidobacteriota bacterium]